MKSPPLVLLVQIRNQEQQQFMQEAIRQYRGLIEPFFFADIDATAAHLQSCLEAESNRPMPTLILIHIDGLHDDGWHLLQRLKQTQTFRAIPVVLINQSVTQEEVYRAYHNGVASYLPEPTTQEQWIACFRSLIDYWSSVITIPQYLFH